MKALSVYGLGKLGSSMLACFAEKGWTVVGMDINQDSVDKVNRGESPIYEPGVAELIAKNSERISATTDPVMAAKITEASFIIVPTPSLGAGNFTSEYVIKAAEGIAEAIKLKNSYHLVIVTSTVMPGETEKVKKYIEAISGKKCGEHFGVCYNPDFIALGNIINDFTNPDMILIGESDEKAGTMLSEIHWQLTDNDPEIHRMNFQNAELSKISLNAYCTLKITYANVMAEICEKMPGGDAHAVLEAVGADSRVGKKYFKPGLAYSGPCFPRDGRAFDYHATSIGVIETLAKKTDQINEYQAAKRIPDKILSLINEYQTVSVLGLTYKEKTTLVEESAALITVKKLLDRGIRVHVYDPAGMEEAKKELGWPANLVYADSIKECIKDTSLCFVATPWQDFKNLTEGDFLGLSGMAPDPIILDAWNLYDFDEIRVIKIGKNNE